MTDIKKLKSAIEAQAETALKALHSFRHEIENINDELHWIENSPLPLVDAYVKIEEFIKVNSKKESIESFFHDRELGGLKPFEANTKLDSSISVAGSQLIGNKGTADLANMMCSLFGKSVEQGLKSQAEEAAKNINSGPLLAERKQIKADLLDKQHKIELDEEALISQAEELGLIGFYRRPDCNPEIVLMMHEDEK